MDRDGGPNEGEITIQKMRSLSMQLAQQALSLFLIVSLTHVSHMNKS